MWVKLVRSFYTVNEMLLSYYTHDLLCYSGLLYPHSDSQTRVWTTISIPFLFCDCRFWGCSVYIALHDRPLVATHLPNPHSLKQDILLSIKWKNNLWIKLSALGFTYSSISVTWARFQLFSTCLDAWLSIVQATEPNAPNISLTQTFWACPGKWILLCATYELVMYFNVM